MNSLRLILTAVPLLAGTLHAQQLPDVEESPGGAPCRRGELIVQFKQDVTDAQIAEAFRAGALALIKHVQTPAMADHGEIGITHAQTSLPIPAALRILKNLPGVSFAEPNFIVSAQADANDPFYLDGSLWGMFGDDYPSPSGPVPTTNPFGSQAEKAWAGGFTGSKDVFVGVVDTGLQFDHPDLAQNVWTNPGEIPGNGIDDDGDGYVDDVHGWNAIDDNGTTYEPGYDDHGTHVSGTIGGVGGNGIGVAGVNWNVTLISGKFLGHTSGATLDAIQAIDYMTALKTRKGLNIVALNNSWGGAGFSQALLDSISRAAQSGILFVAAAGNGSTNTDVAPFYPAAYNTAATAGYDSVISVAAIDKDGYRAGFSDYGQSTVDLGAPGVDVISTIPHPSAAVTVGGQSYFAGEIANAATGTAVANLVDGGKALASDPSWAGKVVLVERGENLFFDKVMNVQNAGGVAALIYNTNSGGFSGTLGDGHSSTIPALSLSRDLGLFLKGSALGLSTTVFSPAANAPGSGYGYGNGTSMATPHVSGAIALYSSTHPGATPSQARNDLMTAGVRPSPALQGITVTGGTLDIGSLMAVPPMGLPAPAEAASVQAVAVSAGHVDVSWIDQSSNELGFVIERSTDGVTFVLADTVGANFTAKSDRTVHPNTAYWYRVRAYNAGGASAYAYAPAPVTTPFLSMPAAPTSLTATAQAKGGGIALAWKDNSNNEDAFQLERKTGSTGTWQLLTSLSANTTRYTDASTTSRTTYYYRLRAYNEAGASAYSNEASATAK